MLTREIPFLRICLPLSAGIVSGLYILPGTVILVPALVVVLTGFAFSVPFNKSEINIIFGLTLSLSLFICGLLLYNNRKGSITVLEPRQYLIGCTLSDYPVEKPNSHLLKVKLNCRFQDDKAIPAEGSLLLYYRKDPLPPGMTPGDLLLIRCTPVEITAHGNPYEFDYKFYMENQGIRYYSFANRKSIVSHVAPHRRKLIHKALILREKIIGMYKERGITGESLALVAAITLGQKNLLEADQKISFMKAGVMHIMAVSGLHTGILSLFVFNILFFLKGRLKTIRILLTIVALWSFAFITGLTPSVLRATMMFSFLHAGNLMKRPVNGINSVLASAFILIIFKPSVIFETGFLLSYSAVIYIIAFYRDFYQKLVLKNYLADKIWQSAAVTITAQAGTLPLTIALFNRFPAYFILTNILIVPLSALLVITGCLVALLFPLKFVSLYLAIALKNLATLTEFLAHTVAALPFASIDNVGMTTLGCLLFTATLFLFSLYLLRPKSVTLIYPLSALFICISAGTAREISVRTSNELIVYNTPGSSTIGIRTGKILNLFTGTGMAGPEVKRHCATIGLRVNLSNTGLSPGCFKAGNTRILITDSLNNKIMDNFSPDIVVLTGKRPVIDLGSSVMRTGITIIAADGLPGFSKSYNKNTRASLRLYAVRKAGAFVRSI